MLLDNLNKNYQKKNKERLTHKHSAEPHDRICPLFLLKLSVGQADRQKRVPSPTELTERRLN